MGGGIVVELGVCIAVPMAASLFPSGAGFLVAALGKRSWGHRRDTDWGTVIELGVRIAVAMTATLFPSDAGVVDAALAERWNLACVLRGAGGHRGHGSAFSRLCSQVLYLTRTRDGWHQQAVRAYDGGH